MARRKNNILKDILEITSQIPWWISLSLAVASYLALSNFSSQEIVSTNVNGKPDIGLMVTGNIFKGFAQVGQFILPFVFVLSSVSSAVRQYKRKKLLINASNSSEKSVIDSMSWREFEMLVGEVFKGQGYKVTETPKGADGGVDLVLSKEDKKILVQCKHWKTKSVGVKTVRELYGVLTASNADEVNIVCSGQFTNEAEIFVKDKPLYLIDGDALYDIVHGETGVKHMVSNHDVISCPNCESSMVLRLAKKGLNVGNKFYGCSMYPKCKGTRDFS